jgi:hypothetical protein
MKERTDTERLDWIERQCFEVRNNSADPNNPPEYIGDVMLSGAFGRQFSCEVGTAEVTGIYGASPDSLREAIDLAMDNDA